MQYENIPVRLCDRTSFRLFPLTVVMPPNSALEAMPSGYHGHPSFFFVYKIRGSSNIHVLSRGTALAQPLDEEDFANGGESGMGASGPMFFSTVELRRSI